ncbi:KATANIN P80 SUBUNIT [Salix purpurea]|uniref:Katanin p80 WD40 repeat-containing subunit B1 homolog n=1 Tax=Salix purpurea TaxID=77065 RepID=A0A9Q0WMG0_SALPP|nr:KATANIN P80 SUBUNIT [Salix purpurea]
MKIEEFVAHSTNVNCLSIGKKACRMFITGGDDHKVNLWAIGKPTSLMSLCGHTSPVESVAFDTSEVLVLAGASMGAIKLWDLEEAKMVRTLTGHRSSCTAVEFHPFGEFFASGSTDTNVRIWDIRKKGCIHTYKGHTRGISTIRFTPDGRWVVSGGCDNVVKVWDLTAGKLLHDFKFHEGHVRSIDFHPLEFLLATGSADRTVKFWDLETFELIGSTTPEATGVRSITFHPDGRTLFCGLDDSLKVYSWEPVICHDAVDMGNSVGIWVGDISCIEPYGDGFVPEESECTDQKFNILGRNSSDKAGSDVKSTLGFRSPSPDYETKEIKNIYVDSTGGNPVTLQRAGSLNSSKVVLSLDSKETSAPLTEKQSPLMGMRATLSEQAYNKSLSVPTVVPRDIPVEKDSSDSGKETITFTKTKPGMLLRPAHVRRPSNSKNDVDKMSVALESGNFSSVTSEKGSVRDPNPSLQSQIVTEDGARKSCENKSSSIKGVTEKFEKVVISPETPNQGNCDESVKSSKEIAPVKIVNGVAVVSGRTRSLVERFERRDKLSNEEELNTGPQTVPESNRTSTTETNMTPPVISGADRTPVTSNMTPLIVPETDRPATIAPKMNPCFAPETDNTASAAAKMISIAIPERDRTATIATKSSPRVLPETDRKPYISTNMMSRVTSQTDRTAPIAVRMTSRVIPATDRTPPVATIFTPRVAAERDRTPPIPTNTATRTPPVAAVNTPRVTPERNRTPPIPTNTATPVIPEVDRIPSITTNFTPRIVCEMDRAPPNLNEEPQISGRDSTSANYKDVIEDLMQSHDLFLNTLKSRLTKLQVIRHFWERNDIKGAINALRKLPDYSVQVDVISVLMDKMEILNLDLFSCLLPVLVGLLDSKMERHANISLEMLLKLVAVFGPVIRSAVSSPPVVGVDLHAEQRRECCNQCFAQLQKIQQILPALARRGGLLTKSALELNLVLQRS